MNIYIIHTNALISYKSCIWISIKIPESKGLPTGGPSNCLSPNAVTKCIRDWKICSIVANRANMWPIVPNIYALKYLLPFSSALSFFSLQFLLCRRSYFVELREAVLSNPRVTYGIRKETTGVPWKTRWSTHGLPMDMTNSSTLLYWTNHDKTHEVVENRDFLIIWVCLRFKILDLTLDELVQMLTHSTRNNRHFLDGKKVFR